MAPRKSGTEALHMADPIDEYSARQLKERDEKKLISLTTACLDIVEADEKRMTAEQTAETAPPTDHPRKALNDREEEVTVRKRKAVTPSAVTENGMPAKTESITKAQATSGDLTTLHSVLKTITEAAPKHSMEMEIGKKAIASKPDNTLKDPSRPPHDTSLLNLGYYPVVPSQVASQTHHMTKPGHSTGDLEESHGKDADIAPSEEDEGAASEASQKEVD